MEMITVYDFTVRVWRIITRDDVVVADAADSGGAAEAARSGGRLRVRGRAASPEHLQQTLLQVGATVPHTSPPMCICHAADLTDAPPSSTVR